MQSGMVFLLSLLYLNWQDSKSRNERVNHRLVINEANLAECQLSNGSLTFILDINRCRVFGLGAWLVFVDETQGVVKPWSSTRYHTIFVPKHQLQAQEFCSLCRVLIWSERQIEETLT